MPIVWNVDVSSNPLKVWRNKEDRSSHIHCWLIVHLTIKNRVILISNKNEEIFWAVRFWESAPSLLIGPFETSRTVWQNSNIIYWMFGHLQQWKIVQYYKLFAKAGDNFCPILNKPLKYLEHFRQSSKIWPNLVSLALF